MLYKIKKKRNTVFYKCHEPILETEHRRHRIEVRHFTVSENISLS